MIPILLFILMCLENFHSDVTNDSILRRQRYFDFKFSLVTELASCANQRLNN